MVDIKSESTIRLLVTGDYHPTDEISKFISTSNSPKDIFGDLLPLLASSDLAITNLEIPATDEKKKIIKAGPHGKTDLICIEALKNAGFSLVTFATNHTLDYGAKGFFDTKDYCNWNNISIVGAGKNLADARSPFITTINNINVAILNYCETEFNISGEDSPGANPLDLINVYNDIKKLKNDTDHIIVIIHAGQDFVFHPSSRVVRVFRFIAEQGVSAVIGHHTHYISSFEYYKGVPIVYSLGHLIYLYNKNDIFTRLFYVAKMLLTKTKCNIELIPFEFDLRDFKVKRLGSENGESFTSKALELNEHIKDELILHQYWFKENNDINVIRNLSFLTGIPIIIFRVFKKLKLLSILNKILWLRKKRYLSIWNYSKCEHHLCGVNYLFNELFYKNGKS